MYAAKYKGAADQHVQRMRLCFCFVLHMQNAGFLMT